jgi:hypothetical protein
MRVPNKPRDRQTLVSGPFRLAQNRRSCKPSVSSPEDVVGGSGLIVEEIAKRSPKLVSVVETCGTQQRTPTCLLQLLIIARQGLGGAEVSECGSFSVIQVCRLPSQTKCSELVPGIRITCSENGATLSLECSSFSRC